jgi:hypothetical protein
MNSIANLALHSTILSNIRMLANHAPASTHDSKLLFAHPEFGHQLYELAGSCRMFCDEACTPHFSVVADPVAFLRAVVAAVDDLDDDPSLVPADALRRYGFGHLIDSKEHTHDLGAVLEYFAEHADAIVAQGYTEQARSLCGIQELTDIGNAECLVRNHGHDLRYSKATGWRIYQDGRWLANDALVAERWAKDIARRVIPQYGRIEARTTVKPSIPSLAWMGQEEFKEAVAAELNKYVSWARKTEGDARIKAMLSRAAAEPGVAIMFNRFDSDPWLLNCVNGTLDLRTGRLLAHRREDYMMQQAPVVFDPDATCLTWERFLGDIFRGDQDLVAFVQRAVGGHLENCHHPHE